MSVRKTATWMCQLDERILEHLDEEPWASPSVLEREIRMDASEGRIKERCQLLADAGLIHPIYREMYELTTVGQLYLDGDLDARHQPKPRPSRLL